MEVVETIAQMQARSDHWRQKGQRIACVPTMGFLHEGHLSLMREGRKLGDKLVVSIFVNPAQFGPGEDLSRYPKDFEGDLDKCRSVGVDCVFAPAADEIYPPSYQTYVNVERVSQGLCAGDRPGHFRGVTTVVTKLFNMIKPHVALFGEKDFQQLRVIQRMARDLDMDIQVLGKPTVREDDGLAMSSRNAYLSPEQRKSALCLYNALCQSRDSAAAGVNDVGQIISQARELIEQTREAEVMYIEIVDDETLEKITIIQKPARMALAVGIGQTRLIDNIQLIPGNQAPKSP